MINAADGKRYIKGKHYGSKGCTYCGRTSHTVETCFRKHGFPPGSKMKNYSLNVNNTVCEGKEMEDNNGSYIDKDSTPRDSPVTGLSNEECRTLLNLL